MDSPRDIVLKGLPALFEELAKPDQHGVSREIPRGELVGRYAQLDNFGNGGSWCRSDGALGGKYIIDRRKNGPSGSRLAFITSNQDKQGVDIVR